MKTEEADGKHVCQFQSRCKLEVEALHRVFVSWFRGLKAKEDLRRELMDRLMPNFSHVAPNGQFIQGRSTLINNLGEKYACFPKDQGFEIEADNVKVIWKQGQAEGIGDHNGGGRAGAPNVSIPGLGNIGAATQNDDDELSNYDGLILITFEEWHKWKETNGSISRFGRLSTCLLRERPTDGNFSWIHVHETWLQDTPLTGNGGMILDEESDEHGVNTSSDEDDGDRFINSESEQRAIPKHSSFSDSNKKLTSRKSKDVAKNLRGIDTNDTRILGSSGNDSNDDTADHLPAPPTSVPSANSAIAAIANSSSTASSQQQRSVVKARAAPSAPIPPKRATSEQHSEISPRTRGPAAVVPPPPVSAPSTSGMSNDHNSSNTNKMFTQQVAQRNVSLRRHFSPQLPEYAKPFMMGSELLGVSISGWDIGTSQGPIGDDAWFLKAIENYENRSQSHDKNNRNGGGNGDPNNSKRRLNLPEMVFPAAHVALEHRDNNLWISWDVLDALDSWAKAHQSIPIDTDISSNGVSVFRSEDAAFWKRSNKVQHFDGENNNTDNNTSNFHYDWTFSSPFCGAVDGGAWEKLDKSGISVDLLKDKSQPILFFDEIVLYEDDLHDNGQVQFSIKIRVMPSCTFLLARMWVRIDRVLLRLRETRILINFSGSKQIYRDVTWRECKWEQLDHYKLPTNLRVWCREGNETPALASLLSRLPQVDPPKDIYRHAVLKLSSKNEKD